MSVIHQVSAVRIIYWSTDWAMKADGGLDWEKELSTKPDYSTPQVNITFNVVVVPHAIKACTGVEVEQGVFLIWH
jgi:hypothetical protein